MTDFNRRGHTLPFSWEWDTLCCAFFCFLFFFINTWILRRKCTGSLSTLSSCVDRANPPCLKRGNWIRRIVISVAVTGRTRNPRHKRLTGTKSVPAGRHRRDLDDTQIPSWELLFFNWFSVDLFIYSLLFAAFENVRKTNKGWRNHSHKNKHIFYITKVWIQTLVLIINKYFALIPSY